MAGTTNEPSAMQSTTRRSRPPPSRCEQGNADDQGHRDVAYRRQILSSARPDTPSRPPRGRVDRHVGAGAFGLFGRFRGGFDRGRLVSRGVVDPIVSERGGMSGVWCGVRGRPEVLFGVRHAVGRCAGAAGGRGASGGVGVVL